MSVLVLLAFCATLYILWSWLRPRPHSPPILPGSLPLIGHAHQLFGNRKHLWIFLKYIYDYSLRHGGVIEFWLGPHTFYVVTDPDDIGTVANACLTKSYFYDFAKDFLNNGLITADAVTWKSHRKLLNPAFNQQVLNTFMNEINIQARSLVSDLEEKVGKEPFDVRNHFIEFTLKTVSRTSLGLDTKDQKMIDNDYAEAFHSMLNSYCERSQKLWLHFSFVFNISALKRKQAQLKTKLNGYINPVIRKRKMDLKTKSSTDDNDTTRPGKFKPILDLMLHLADEKDAFTDDEIREHLDTFVAASYDTTSTALTYIMICIGSYKDVQEKIVEEIQEVLENADRDVGKEELTKLVYLEAVIKETLRLYPVVPWTGRKIDINVKLKNYTLKAGTTCFMGIYGLHCHPMWGSDVKEFKPERWLNSATVPDHPNVYSPFGIGKRYCIGKQYSMMVMKTTLAHLLRRYRINSNIEDLVSEFDVVLKPVSGHLLTLSSRT
ncbi:unnamed protein product [Spodoptera littoralis]|uniref:Cytochrome n=1 Tax=Spodoptera littoralis TaxID=7109 RepID=A0A9P0I8Z6_SPOLI|nr:unnamed protein product [Spodoptera littoralis]